MEALTEQLFDRQIYATDRDYIALVRELGYRQQQGGEHQPTVYTHSYGCQQNVADGEKLDGLFLEMGYIFAESPLEADVVLYNTCAVREGAEDRVFGNVGALKKAKAANPNMVIALCGCMTQQEHVARRIRRSFSFVDIVFGAGAMHRLPALLYQKLTEGGRIFELADPTAAVVEGLPVHRQEGARAWLPIMYGCDNFCSFCVVPLVRGRERSRKPEEILREAGELIAKGYREITLLGQNVNSYGKGLEETINFSELLKRLCSIPGDFRLRFMTSHPKDCTRELIDTIAENEKIYNHIHLPVQSGSDHILREMNRGYTAAQYLELISYARERIPGVTFTSDIIVGFPGETSEDFEQTLELVKQLEAESLFTFLYSKREGTRAAKMDDPISPQEKKLWFQELCDLQNSITSRHLEDMVGGVYAVLVDGPARTPDLLSGRNYSNIIVDFPGSPDLIGQFVAVKVTRAMHFAAAGELAEK